MAEHKEPEIIIDGQRLTEGEAMSVRCAIARMIGDFHDQPDALGTDDHGRTMVKLYLQNLRAAESKMRCFQR
jgi:hypothetical protein